MPLRVRSIGVSLAGAIVFTVAVAVPESSRQATPQKPAAAVDQLKLPTTFVTRDNVKTTVVSSTATRLRLDATAPSGIASAITIEGPATVMERSMVEAFIDLVVALGKVVTGSKAGKCTQTIKTTVTAGGSTTTIETTCTAAQ